jgi:hypothetical protein
VSKEGLVPYRLGPPRFRSGSFLTPTTGGEFGPCHEEDPSGSTPRFLKVGVCRDPPSGSFRLCWDLPAKYLLGGGGGGGGSSSSMVSLCMILFEMIDLGSDPELI